MGNQNSAHDSTGDPTAEQRQIVANRLSDAGLSIDRFIDVEEGRKQSYDHTTGGPGSVRGNYGVYAGDELVGVDLDDYDDRWDTTAVDELPATFTVETAHGGEHRYYRVRNDAVSKLRVITGGAANISLAWGDIHALNKYLVGPGYELIKCSKSGCATCRYGDSSYAIAENRPIATIAADALGEVLLNDPQFGVESPNQRRLNDF